MVTPEQRQLLDKNYGIKDDPVAEQKVRDLFNDLNLKQLYLDYEQDIASKLTQMIEQIDESRGFKGQVLTEFLNKVYKRDK